MAVTIQEVCSRRTMKQFVFLPEQLHRNHAGWVPPFYGDDLRTFSPHSNPAHTYCDCTCALALENGNAVGRIAGIVNHRYNQHTHRKDARFGYLECPRDSGVAHALLEYVERWAAAKGMDRIVGPAGFTEEDPEGFMVEGFDQTPNLATYCNFEFLPGLVEHEGYGKEIDYVVYKVDLAHAISDSYRRIYERIARQKTFRLVQFTTKRELEPYILPMLRLMDETFQSIYGYSSLTDREMARLAKRYLPLVDPRFIKVVVDTHGATIGFIIGIPDIADGIRKARGRLFPFGAFKILRSLRTSKTLVLYLGGIKESFRGRGIDFLLGYSVMSSALDAGFEIMDSHHELETNTRMRAEMEGIGGHVYKRYRIYQKNLV